MLLLALTAVLTVAACGGDDGGPPAATAPTTSSSPQASGTSGPDATPTPSPTPDPGPSPGPGTTIAGEPITPEQAAELQHEVDDGHQPWRTDIAAVADAFVRSHLGWDEADVALADPHTAEVTHPADGRIVTLQLRQPVREGSGGIWVVVSGVWLV